MSQSSKISVSFSGATASVTLTPKTTLNSLIDELKVAFKLNTTPTTNIDILVRNGASGASIGWLSESSVSPFDTHVGCQDEKIDPRYELGVKSKASAGVAAVDSESDESESVSDSDDTSDDDDDDNAVTDVDELRARLRKARAHVKEATVTIAALVEQFTSYKSEVELSHVRLTEHLGRTEDRAKVEREETIANLQTLMNELELIEQKNLQLNDELEAERHEHQATIEELASVRRQLPASGATTTAATATTTTTTTTTAAAAASSNGTAAALSTPLRGGGSFLRRGTESVGTGTRTPQQALHDIALLVRQMSSVLGDVDSSVTLPTLQLPLSASLPATPVDKLELGVSSQSVSRIRQTISRLQTPAKVVSKRASVRDSNNKLVSPRRTSSSSHAVTLPAAGKTAVLCAIVVSDSIWLSLADCSLVVVSRATCAPTKTLPRRDLDPQASPISLMRAYGDSVWAATSDGNVLQLDATSGALRKSWRAHPKKIADLVVVEDLSVANSYNLWTCCSADMLLKTWSSSGELLLEQRLPNLMLCFLVHAGLLWLGTESSILRFNIQTFRRLDTLRRLDGESLRSANQLLSVGDDVFAVCDDGIIAQFAVHGECVRHIETGRLTAVGVVGEHMWLGASGAIRLLSRNAEWLGTDMRFPSGVDAVLAILPVDATLATPDGPAHVVAVTVTIDAQLVAWTAPASSELNAQPAEIRRKAAWKKRDDKKTPAAASTPPMPTRSSSGKAIAAGGPSTLDDDLSDLLQLMAKNRGQLTTAKKEEQRKVAVTSGRELVQWFERFVTGIGSHTEAIEFGKRLQGAGRLHPVEGDADSEFSDDETLWSLDLRSHKGSVLGRLFRKRKTSPGIAVLQQQDDLKRSQSKRAAMPPQANKSSLAAVLAVSSRADEDESDVGSSTSSTSVAAVAPAASAAQQAPPSQADDEKKRVKSRTKWHHKLRVYLERASGGGDEEDEEKEEEEDTVATVSVREATTEIEVKRALLNDFNLTDVDPDDYALVAVVENRMCVCQLINPLRQSLKLKRADERFELWRVPANDGEYEAWDEVGVPMAGDADDAQHVQLREGAKFGMRPASRPLIAPTHVVVLHEYVAAADDEVSLQKGDIVRLYMRGADADWWHGEIVLRAHDDSTSDTDNEAQEETKRIGLFPSSFTNGVAKKQAQGQLKVVRA